MGVVVETAREDDVDAMFALRVASFRARAREKDDWTDGLELDCWLVAREGPEVVGTLAVHPAAQFFGGRSVPVGAVASVAVAPEHRGRGVAAALLRAAIGLMRDRGDVLSVLHPATTAVYRRFGWELAGDTPLLRVPTAALAAITPGEDRRVVRAGREDAARLCACYDEIAPHHPGWFDRSDWWWRRASSATFDDEHGHVFMAEVDPGAVPLGYVRYRTYAQPSGWGFGLRVDEMVSRDASTERALWRLLGSHASQVETVDLVRVDASALSLLLPEQIVQPIRSFRWMLRVVDAPAALMRRGYAPTVSGSALLDLEDVEVPDHAGRWRFEVADGEGRMQRDRAGSVGTVVRITARGLATLYTGAETCRTLAHADLLHGPDDDLAFLDAAFSESRPVLTDDF